MATVEIKIGSIVMLAEPTDDRPHVLVILRGKGEPGQRPLLGQVTMSREEWQDVCDHIEQGAVDEEAFRRIAHVTAYALEVGAFQAGHLKEIAGALDSRDGGDHETAGDFRMAPPAVDAQADSSRLSTVCAAANEYWNGAPAGKESERSRRERAERALSKISALFEPPF